MTTFTLVAGDESTCRAFLRGRPGHYVYVLRRPDGRPFYVGKGYGDRAFQHENEARHPNNRRSNAYKLNVIRAIWRSGRSLTYEIDGVFGDPEGAFLREAELIGVFKRLHEGGPLTNLAPGGGSSAGPAPESLEKHSATLAGVPGNNPERAILNRFFLSIAPVGSVPIKPLKQFTPRPTQRYPQKSMMATRRQSVALVASAAVNGISLDAACRLPRRVTVEDAVGLIENGVSCDILTSGLATVVPAGNPADEWFDLTAEQVRKVIGLVGYQKCVDLGVLTAPIT